MALTVIAPGGGFMFRVTDVLLVKVPHVPVNVSENAPVGVLLLVETESVVVAEPLTG